MDRLLLLGLSMGFAGGSTRVLWVEKAPLKLQILGSRDGCVADKHSWEELSCAVRASFAEGIPGIEHTLRHLHLSNLPPLPLGVPHSPLPFLHSPFLSLP